jgi:hypothetical protein
VGEKTIWRCDVERKMRIRGADNGSDNMSRKRMDMISARRLDESREKL